MVAAGTALLLVVGMLVRLFESSMSGTPMNSVAATGPEASQLYLGSWKSLLVMFHTPFFSCAGDSSQAQGNVSVFACAPRGAKTGLVFVQSSSVL
jgi:hypothetical protein